MGLNHVFIPLDQKFKENRENLNNNYIIVNDLANNPKTDNDFILNNILTVYESDVMSTVPTCGCDEGGLRGTYNLGQICPNCGMVVKNPQDNIESTLYLRALYSNDVHCNVTSDPRMIPFISPAFWGMLSKVLYNGSKRKVKIDYLHWLADKYVTIPEEATSSPHHQVMLDILNNIMGGKQDYVTLINNIGRILEYIRQHPLYAKDTITLEDGSTISTSKQINSLIEIYNSNMNSGNGNVFYSEYLPVISKHIFIVEKSKRGKFTQLKLALNIDSVKSWLNLCKDINKQESLRNVGLKNNRRITGETIGRTTAKIVSTLSKLYSDYIKEYVFKKSGLLRKHCGGAKGAFTWRGVIRSISGQHDSHGVEIPWSVAVTVFTPHIRNKMLKMNYSMRDIDRIIYRSVKSYDPLIHKIIEEIRSEAPNGRVPMIIQRNPSLLRGSANLVYISKVSTDVHDKTIGFSQLIAKYSNAENRHIHSNCGNPLRAYNTTYISKEI